MIRSLTGTVTTTTDQTVVIDVQGVGYLVFTPPYTHAVAGQAITLHTHLAVRETALDLYGFQLADELVLFEQLLTLPKIGPKSALQILSQANLELIKTAIINNDAAHLSKMSGIGKKTAEKVVAGLTEMYEKDGLLVDLQSAPVVAEGGHLRDTIDALVALGYPEVDARKVVQTISETKPELTNTNDILKAALHHLS